MELVKVCGITCATDAEAAVAAGVDAIGLNLIESSPRYIEWEVAREIARAVYGRVRTVAVVEQRDATELDALRQTIGVDELQVHSRDPRALALPERAYLAVGIGGPADVERARACPGELLLVDAKVAGMLGGSGVSFDWHLVSELGKARRLILAGGLGPENVAEAVALVRPFGVDVASGVQVTGDPRRKDPELMRRFVEAARSSGGRR